MSSNFYDVIIIGAGPAGSYAAFELASSGHSVAVLEQKSEAGIDVCCSGIVSTECFDSFGISSEVIVNRINSAKIISPSGKYLKLISEKVQAYVIDMAAFEQAIALKAQAKGTEYLFSSHVSDISIGKAEVQVEATCRGSREIINSRAVILASGFSPRLCQKLGLGKIGRFVFGSQTEIKGININEIEIYFGQRTAPGFFAWLVPVSAEKALAGLITTSHAKLHLERFLLESFCQDRIKSRVGIIGQKVIPMGILPCTYGDRILVIGDAAGQVKPTTGGGIYFGHIAAKIAAKVLSEGLNRDELTADQLSHYQKQWKSKIGREISMGYRARQIYTRLSDYQIDKIISVLDSMRLVNALLNSPNLSFDFHSKLVIDSLKYALAYPLKKARHPLQKGVQS